MITYTYKCKECDHVFEAKQNISDDNLTDCPECKVENAIIRILQPAGGFRIGGAGVSNPTSTYYW